MPKAFKSTLLSIRDLLVSAGPFILLALVLLALAYWWLNPNPPRTVRLATGPAQSAYDEFGKRYQRALAADRIRVELVPSEGSSHNLMLLREGQADFAFVQGGTSDRQSGDEDNLLSLGSLFLEPVWIFYREDSARRVLQASARASQSGRLSVRPGTAGGLAGGGTGGTATYTLTALPQLKGMRMNVGTPGSGVPNLVNRLLEANGVDPASLTLSQLGHTSATVAFLNGDLDAIVFVSAPESLIVQMLLMTPGVKLLDFPQAEAYARRFSFLSSALLPRGVVDLAGDRPPQNIRLVAPTTALLARGDAHPALVQLFSQASLRLHGGAGWFNRARQFPNVENNELPIARDAERTIRGGGLLLQRYMPFWLANLIERMWLALTVIIAVLIPLSRIVPPLYQLRVRSRIFRWYAQLRDIETRADAAQAQRQELLEEINSLDSRCEKIAVPLAYAEELYALRANIHLVRKKVLRLGDGAAQPA